LVTELGLTLVDYIVGVELLLTHPVADHVELLVVQLLNVLEGDWLLDYNIFDYFELSFLLFGFQLDLPLDFLNLLLLELLLHGRETELLQLLLLLLQVVVVLYFTLRHYVGATLLRYLISDVLQLLLLLPPEILMHFSQLLSIFHIFEFGLLLSQLLVIESIVLPLQGMQAQFLCCPFGLVFVLAHVADFVSYVESQVESLDLLAVGVPR